jgi:hypothetical protein
MSDSDLGALVRKMGRHNLVSLTHDAENGWCVTQLDGTRLPDVKYYLTPESALKVEFCEENIEPIAHPTDTERAEPLLTDSQSHPDQP